jgi:hypothetical protein
MTQSGYRHRILIVDRSGSMEDILAGMQSGYREFIQSERAATPDYGKLTISLWDFDDEICRRHAFAAVDDVAGYVLEPRGKTALYDAQADAIDREGEDLARLPEDQRPEDVTVLTITDGLNNVSRRHTAATVKAKITHQETVYGWRFLLIGTNIDVAAEAAATGVHHGQSLSYATSSAGSQGAWRASASYLLRAPVAAAASAGSLSFTDEERQLADGNEP